MRRIALTLLCLIGLVGCTSGKSPALPHVSAPQATGDGWESSGGSGVACFDSEATAKEADHVLASQGSLTDDLRNRILSLVTLEYWEQEGHLHFVAANGPYTTLLADVRKILREFTPIFAGRFDLVEARLEFPKWESSRRLPIIEDRHPKRPVESEHPKCRLVQLAVRYTRSHPGRVPEARVEVDGKLFREKLDPLNQAMLVLHEQFYLLGKEIGHQTSDALREVVAKFLSEELRASLDLAPFHSHAARIVQLAINSIYGDYFLFFLDEPSDHPEHVPAGPSQYSRYRAFARVLAKGRDRKGACLKEHDYQHQTKEKQRKLQEDCSRYSIWPYDLPADLDDEETFVFVGRWLLDTPGYLDTSENLVVFDRAHPELITPLQHKELRRACEALLENYYPNFVALVEKARRYCWTLEKVGQL